MPKPSPEVMSLLVMLATRVRYAQRQVRAARRLCEAAEWEGNREDLLTANQALNETTDRMFELRNAFYAAKETVFAGILHPPLRTVACTRKAGEVAARLRALSQEPPLTAEEVAFASSEDR